MLCKACIVGIYQRKLEEIARRGVELTVAVPPSWRDRRGETLLEPLHTQGYDLRVLPVRWNGNYHLYHFQGLGQLLEETRPDLIHVDEEPYNLATYLGIRQALSVGAVPVFFTWQNLKRRYPFPFSWFERFAYRNASAIAGTKGAAGVLKAKGYRGEMAVIPQFGVDPEFFSPRLRDVGGEFVIGYAGGLLPEKGVDLILKAAAGLPGNWAIRLLGDGESKGNLVALSQRLGIADRVSFLERIPSARMPQFYSGLDVLVLPSRTTPSWKEQFGRVLVEAMSCGVPVVGSDSGAIPDVVGDAGLTFPEGDADALRECLVRLVKDHALRRALSLQGRRRVLERFTQATVAEATVAFYHDILNQGAI